MDDLPRSIAGFLQRLGTSRFELVEEDTDGPMGSGLLIYRRDAIQIRLINDRGQWTADLLADGWPEGERLAFPVFASGTPLPR